MAVFQEQDALIIPTDVFGAEPSTDAGYAREVVALTLASGDTVNVGRLLVINDVEKTARFAVAADVFDTVGGTVVTTTRLGIFLGRDLNTNGAGHRSYLEASFTEDGATVNVVVIDRGYGSGQVAEGYLHLGEASVPASFFHNQTADVQKALRTKLKLENGFKVQRQVKPLLAIV
jgi:hypothetical protein